MAEKTPEILILTERQIKKSSFLERQFWIKTILSPANKVVFLIKESEDGKSMFDTLLNKLRLNWQDKEKLLSALNEKGHKISIEDLANKYGYKK